MNASTGQFVQRSGLTLSAALVPITQDVVVFRNLAAHLCFCSPPVQEALA